MMMRPNALAMDLQFDDVSLTVVLADGREIRTPLAWFPTLNAASAEARANWRLIGGGVGIHWPDLHEDLSVEGLLAR